MNRLFRKKGLILALLPLSFIAILPLSCCDTHVSHTWSEAELTPLLADSIEGYVSVDYPNSEFSDFEVLLVPERLEVSCVVTIFDVPFIPDGSSVEVAQEPAQTA